MPAVDGQFLKEGKLMLKAQGEDAIVRYLGAWIGLSLDWSVQVARMDRLVWSVAASIKRNKFDLVISKTAINQFLLPGLRTGLLLAKIPEDAVRCWDARLRRAALSGADISLGDNLCVEAFYAALRFPPSW